MVQAKKSVLHSSFRVFTLQYLITELIVDEKNSKYNKARRSFKQKRIELIAELEKRN